MPITQVEKDTESLTMTITSEHAVPLRRLWDAYADPRQIERFWGPPEWPATFTRHDMSPGGRSEYYMTGPDGEKSGGYWEYLAVEAPNFFEVKDGFANDDGSANTDLPSMRMVYRFEETPDGSRMISTTYFNSAADLESLLEMGMEEGTRAAMGQIDDVLADLASFAADRATEAQILDDTRVRVSRVIRGPIESVWEAHHDPELIQRWLLGPDGWTMPVVEVATEVGDTYRYEWESEADGERFGFTGELLESEAPYRAVTTEGLIGMEGPPSTNEMTLTPVEEGTLVSIVATYPSTEIRDSVLATGMTDGLETSYARLESEVLT